MKKKVLSLLMLGLLVGVSPSMISCSNDYDDDISRLEGLIGKNTDAISAVQNLLKDGVVITNIASSPNGITLTTSDLQTWTLTNGKDGKDGVDGKDADAWTIGEDGYWYKNNVKTDYKAVGRDGKDGKDGTNGTNGSDGGYYEPHSDGYFYYVAINEDGTKATPVKTDISWSTASMSAIKTETGVMFFGVNGYPDGFTISTVAELKSLVFKPQLVVDGVNAINAGALTKNGQIICTPNVIAEYHLNPGTVVEQGINTESVNFLTMTKDFVVTRAVNNVTASYESINNGILRVGVNFTGTPSSGNKIDLVALQVKNVSGETITSDYATIYTNPFASENLFIARGQFITTLGANAHYWDTEAQAKSVALNDAVVNETSVQDKRIIVVQYDKTINLYDEVKTCLDDAASHRRFSDAEMDSYHLKYKFEKIGSFIVDSYEGGLKISTDQQQFIDLAADGTVTPKTYNDGQQLRSSIGRTPIIKATLYHQDGNGPQTVIQEKYVVLEIVDKADPGPSPTAVGYPFYMSVDNAFQAIDFCNDQTASITAEEMNSVYSSLGISKEEFGAQYQPYTGSPVTVDVNGTQTTFQNKGNVTVVTNAGQFTTYGLIWTLTAQEIWDSAGQTPFAQVVFKHKDYPKYVQITLTGGLKLPGHQTVAFPTPGKLVEYWEADSKGVADGRALINVRVPNVGDTNSADCQFTHNLNSFFKPGDDPISAVQRAINNSNYRISSASGVTANSVNLVFKSGMVSGSTTGFNAAGDKLYYNGTLVATLNGTTIDLDHNPTTEKLLNTNEFVVVIGYKATFTSCLGELDIPANGFTEFEARFIRPINVKAESPASFEDGKDFGLMNYTILKAADVINIVDWRNTAVTRGSSYWSYYGIQTVTVDNDNVTVTFPSTGATYKVVDTQIKAGIYNAATAADPDLASGFASNGFGPSDYDQYVFYKNNGGALNEDIMLHFPILIRYYWGTISTQTVNVPVKKTGRINAPRK